VHIRIGKRDGAVVVRSGGGVVLPEPVDALGERDVGVGLTDRPPPVLTQRRTRAKRAGAVARKTRGLPRKRAVTFSDLTPLKRRAFLKVTRTE